jgi:methylase of polypeptide subunit release factors
MLAGGTTAERVSFHWAVEFPEVLANPAAEGNQWGFDAIIGNPPFLGGQRITGVLGTDYRNTLVAHLAHEQRGSAELLCLGFVLK